LLVDLSPEETPFLESWGFIGSVPSWQLTIRSTTRGVWIGTRISPGLTVVDIVAATAVETVVVFPTKQLIVSFAT
jgi:hypothetical protein